MSSEITTGSLGLLYENINALNPSPGICVCTSHTFIFDRFVKLITCIRAKEQHSTLPHITLPDDTVGHLQRLTPTPPSRLST